MQSGSRSLLRGFFEIVLEHVMTMAARYPQRRHGGSEGQRPWRRPYRAPAEIHIHSRAAQLVPPRLQGDSSLLPNVTRMSLVTLEERQMLKLDSKDMTSAFNLFCMPACWTGAFTFSRHVPGSVRARG